VNADLTHIGETDPDNRFGESMPISLSAAMNGDPNANLLLHDGDVLTIRERAGWDNIGASVTVRGEVQHPGSYGISPGERLSSVLERSGGFGPQAYPYGAVLMRKDVREVEKKNQAELVERLKDEEMALRVLPENDIDQKNAKLTAIAKTDSTLDELVANEPIGRVVIHISSNEKSWRGSSTDLTLRDGDVLVVPTKSNYVMVNGQVFNPTAVGYEPGRSAGWYLSQAGGLTPLADRKSVFVIRGDGSVIAAKNNSNGWWSGDPMNMTLRAGDTVVVPEVAPRVGGRNWATILQTAQLASAVALTVAYIHP
jgi:polysaccharide biosynthesis/export protein